MGSPKDQQRAPLERLFICRRPEAVLAAGLKAGHVSDVTLILNTGDRAYFRRRPPTQRPANAPAPSEPRLSLLDLLLSSGPPELMSTAAGLQALQRRAMVRRPRSHWRYFDPIQ